MIAVPPGPDPTLHLVNPGGSPAEVTVTEAGGGARTVSVPAAGAASVPLGGASSVMLGGAEGLHATVAFASGDELAAFGVQPPGPLDSPISVYPD